MLDLLVQSGSDFNLWLEGFRNPLFTGLFKFFSFVGGVYGAIIVLSIILWQLSPQFGFKICYGILGCNLVNTLLKETIGLDRPFLSDPSLNPLARPDAFSFPSGHAQMAAFFWGSIFLYNRQAAIRWLAVIFIFMTGFSRNYLGVHYYFDVLVGWGIGLVLAILYSKLSIESIINFERKKIVQFFSLAAMLLLVFIFPTRQMVMILGTILGILLTSFHGRELLLSRKFVPVTLGERLRVFTIAYIVLGGIIFFYMSVKSNHVFSFLAFVSMAYWMAWGLPKVSMALIKRS